MTHPRLEQRSIEVDGSRLSYTVSGQGQPIVLIHGWAGFWEHILTVAQPATDFQLWAFDMPGWQHPGSLRDGNTLEAFDAALYRGLRALGLARPVHLMGQSMGAISALLFADRHPEMTAGLVLASPPFSLLRRSAHRRLLRWSLARALQVPPLMSVVARAHKARWYNYWITRTTAFYRFDPWFFEQVILPSAQVCDERTSLSHTLSMLDINPWHLAPRVLAPTAIIIGDRDPVISVRTAREAVHLFRHGRLFILHQAKHAIMMEKAADLCDVTFSFLREVSQTPQGEFSARERDEAAA